MSWHNHKFRIDEIYRPIEGNYFRTPGAPSILSIDILTHGGQDTDNKRCKCSRCGMEGMSTSRTPYRPRTKTGPLFCNRCINKEN